MKRITCIFLCLCILCAFPFVATAQAPVIKGIIDGQTVNGDITISWDEIKNADYYTVNVRYIQNSDSGPLLYDAVKTNETSYTLKKSDMDAMGKGAYRICVASYIGGKAYYSPVVVYTYTDVVSPISGKTVVCFGDSLTANGIWEKQLAARFGTSFINAGVGGTTTETSRDRFPTDVLAKNPDITVICFAYNDAVKIDRIASRVSLERYRENLVYYVTELQKAGSDVILMSPSPVIEEYFNANPLHPGEDYVEDGGINNLISKYTDIMAEVAKEYGEYYFDLNAAFDGKDIYSLISTDGTHPNHSGYAYYASALGDFIQKKYGIKYTLGDINGNEKIDMSDYLICRRMIVGTYQADKAQILASDVNESGETDANDYILIKRHFLGTYNITE
ncbi:MAG: hypothetical protein IKM27_06340 [Clostridia bacterium]|nr:hypothetical protein [Clostridia bacterium]